MREKDPPLKEVMGGIVLPVSCIEASSATTFRSSRLETVEHFLKNFIRQAGVFHGSG